MLEIEVKYQAPNLEAIQQQAAAWGARFDPLLQEADQYFNAPDRDFAQTDEALRLRTVGEDNFVTYKGPKTDAQTKTRTEIEVPIAGGPAQAVQFAQLLQRLGYRPVAVVRKRRTIGHLERGGFALEICLDEVDHVGRFVELEIMAQEAALPAARDVLFHVAAELGLGQSERRSYLEMLLTGVKRP